MKTLNSKVIAIFFTENFLGTIYILPLWFISISIFDHVWTGNIGILTHDLVIFLLYFAGCLFFIMLIMACYYWACLNFIHFTYELAHDGLHIHKGAILPKHIIIPYGDIETVELLMNPFIIYFFQLYTLRIKTHDLTNTEGTFRKKQTLFLPGLTSEEARFFRAELLKGSHLTVKKTSFALR